MTQISDSFNKIIPRKTSWLYGGTVTRLDPADAPTERDELPPYLRGEIKKRPRLFKKAANKPGGWDPSQLEG